MWGEAIFKILILFVGVYAIIIITPKLAAFIDRHRKPAKESDNPPKNIPEADYSLCAGTDIPAPRPERVEEENDIKKTANGDDK